MSVSRCHFCIGQEMIALGKEGNEPPAPKCRCRKFISLSEATKMVKRNEARWVVLKREYELVDEVCPMCLGDKEVKNCAQCNGTGKRTVYQAIETYGNDIVYSSEKPKDKKEKKYRPTLAMKTPRVATIESEHIALAYVENVKEAQERIEEYGRLILDARMYVGKDRIPAIGTEPVDDAAKSQGRRYDYGRADFSTFNIQTHPMDCVCTRCENMRSAEREDTNQ
jgi:hypothetical protein